MNKQPFRILSAQFLCIVVFIAVIGSAPTAFAGKRNAAITYSGGDGSSYEKAVIINGATDETGVNAEYQWLAGHYPGYKTRQQALQQLKDKKYDVVAIEVGNKKRTVYFDITGFFGK